MKLRTYPVVWALKHAPVADARERAILLALADHAEADGCHAAPSPEELRRIALCDEAAVEAALEAMASRGLIRPQASIGLPGHAQLRVWELCIPSSFFSATQRAELDMMRARRALPEDRAHSAPLTPDNRPDIPSLTQEV